MKIGIKGILFDMDGVLVSSIGSVERSWTKWANLHGMEPRSTIESAHGRRSIDSVRAMRPDLDAEAENEMIEDWEVEDTEGVERLAGVSELIAQLPPDMWTVVTSATKRLAVARLRAAGIAPPETFITADVVTKGKPDPEPYPHDCMVIEDSVSGATAGHAAGCKVLATTLSHSIESLVVADWIVETLEGIKVTPVGVGQGLELEFQPLPRPRL
jgi:mannitol-1-/sugar-/sorbitol-6-phosphatase